MTGDSTSRALSDELDPPREQSRPFRSIGPAGVNDALLKVFAGDWTALRKLPPGFEERDEVRGTTWPRSSSGRAFPSGELPGPGKIPGTVLLPYWRASLCPPTFVPPVNLVWRSLPCSCAVITGNGALPSLVHGIALWEHYNVAALAALEGFDCYVTS